MKQWLAAIQVLNKVLDLAKGIFKYIENARYKRNEEKRLEAVEVIADKEAERKRKLEALKELEK